MNCTFFEKNGLLIPPERRMQFSVAGFTIVQWHCFFSIACMHRPTRGLALCTRPRSKAFGLARCATDEDIKRYERGPPISELL